MRQANGVDVGAEPLTGDALLRRLKRLRERDRVLEVRCRRPETLHAAGTRALSAVEVVGLDEEGQVVPAWEGDARVRRYAVVLG